MATVHVALATAKTRAGTGATLPLPDSVESGADTLTTSSSSAQSSLVAAAGEIWSVTARDGDVWVKFGANPTAAADTGWMVTTGQTREWGVSAAGEKIAVKDV